MNMRIDSRDPLEFYPGWRDNALCASPENVIENRKIWFHPDEDEPGFDPAKKSQDETKALSICAECPVRALCLRDRLEDQRIYGTSGGLTEAMTRKTLSVDETGKDVRRGDFLDCPFCGASTDNLIPTKIDLPEGGRWSQAKAVKCGECDFEWKARSSHNSVLAFQEDRKKREDLLRRDKIARERLSK